MSSNYKKKNLAVFLTVLFVLCGLTVHTPVKIYAADGDKEIACLGTETITEPEVPEDHTKSWNGSFVYFGRYASSSDGTKEPVKYRVLDPNTEKFGSGTMLLDCHNILYKYNYDLDGDPNQGATSINEWLYSDVRKSLIEGDDSFLNNAFTSAEKNAIAESTIGTHKYADGGIIPGYEDDYWAIDYIGSYTPLTGEKIFLLDVEDIYNQSYGYKPEPDTNSCLVKRYLGGTKGSWFLRSPIDSDATGLNNSGKLQNLVRISKIKYGVSPALNVSLAAILFASPIAETTNEYKLTVLDSSLAVEIDPDKIIHGSGTVTVPYEKTGSADHISLFITNKGDTWSDESGWNDGATVQYYTTEAIDPDKENGTVTFALPENYEANKDDWKLYVVVEKINGGKLTDYASEPSFVRSHAHSWSYSANGAVITAKCNDTVGVCDITSGLELKISKPADLVYDGSAKKASLNKDYDKTAFPDSYEIEYAQGTTKLSGSPVNAGTYTASVTAGKTTASITFTIEPRSITGATVTADTPLKYNEAEQKTRVTGVTLPDGTKLTEDDYDVSGDRGTDAGSYTVTVTGKGNYKDSATAAWRIERGDFSPKITISGWKEGEKANSPVLSGYSGNGTVTIEYKKKGADNSTYSTDVPTEAGFYTVRVRISETTNYIAWEGEADFEIEAAKDKKEEPVIISPLMSKAVVKNDKTVTISWNRIKQADRYVVCMSKCSTRNVKYTVKKVKTIKGSAKISCVISGLEKGQKYKFKVQAQQKTDGKYKIIKSSRMSHFVSGNETPKYTNPKSLKLNKTKVTLKQGKTFLITAKIKPVVPGRKYLTHCSLLRYLSDNKKVAKVNPEGLVKAVKPGSCKIYVHTVNGIWKTLKVTVKESK